MRFHLGSGRARSTGWTQVTLNYRRNSLGAPPIASCLGEAVAMARALGRLPKRVVVFGVEGEKFEVGEQLTPAVAAAVPVVVAAVSGEVQRSSEH